MSRVCAAMVVLLVNILAMQSAWAQSPSAVEKPCLIVKHKSLVGRRLMFGALIGVPIAPGAKFDLVDAIAFQSSKVDFHGKDLQELQSAGVHVIVLENKYSTADLENARKACR